MKKIKTKFLQLLRWSEKYFKTDMVYLAGGTFWLNANFVISSILAFFLSIAYAHLLPKESYGIYQFSLSASSIIGAFTLSGMNIAITRAVSRGFEGSFIKSIYYQLKWSLGALAIGLGVSLYYFLHQNHTLGWALLLVALFSPILNTFNTYSAFVLGKKDFSRLFKNYQVINFTFNAAMIICLFLTDNPVLLVLVNFAANSLATIFLFIITRRHYKPNTEEDPETFKLARHLSFSSFISNAAANLDKIFVFHFIGVIDLAIYTFATNMADRLFSVIRNITISALPRFSVRTAKEIDSTLFSKSIKFFSLSVIAAICYALIAPFFFKIFFSPYLSSVPYSQVYFFMVALISLHMLPLTAMNGLGLHRELYIFNTTTAIFKILIMLVLTIIYGIWGLIIAQGIAGIFNYFLASWLIRRRAAKSESNPIPLE